MLKTFEAEEELSRTEPDAEPKPQKLTRLRLGSNLTPAKKKRKK